MAPQLKSAQPQPALSNAQLVGTAILTLVCLPVLIVSHLPTSQFPAAMPTGLAVLIAIVAFGWLLHCNAWLKTDRLVAAVLLGIFVLRLCLALGIAHWWWLPQTLTAQQNDWDIYEMLGWDLAQSGMSIEVASSYPLNEVGTVYLVGALYSLVGRNPLVLTVFFTFLGTWIALEVANLVALTRNGKAARRAAVLASLMPGSIFIGVLPAKDILVTFCFLRVILLFHQVQVSRGLTWMQKGMALVLVSIVGIVRAMAIPVLIITLMGLFTFGAPKKRIRLIVITAAIGLVGILTVAWRLTELGGWVYFSPISISQLVYERTGGDSATLSDIGLTFATDEVSSIAVKTFWDGEISKAYLVPLRAALLLFVPFPPIYFNALDDVFQSLNTAFMLLLTPAAWAAVAYNQCGWRVAMRELSWLWVPLVVPTIVLAAALPFFQQRYALLPQLFFVGLASVGMHKERRLVALYLLSPFLIVTLYGLYTVMKAY